MAKKQTAPVETNQTPPAGSTPPANQTPDTQAQQTPPAGDTPPAASQATSAAANATPAIETSLVTAVSQAPAPTPEPALIDAEFDVINIQPDALNPKQRYMTLRAVAHPNASNEMPNAAWGGQMPRGVLEIVVNSDVAEKFAAGGRCQIVLNPVKTEGVSFN